ncbi:S66 peptidase family protein [Flavihumibacter petaseus]|uniref:Putative carboxypeptidase n=1 Tax=Flavihumibacter petaseus NBRC 106054 TaxID=1220578 RepID=A0A0E9N6G6_9BACT|nr:LD-carboxypeptidase [Flavihumibacter petaseus]GAO44935.1 putative carboxypeptidase [Flavihumibacter petaseus NBRC 106054]
MTIPPYLKKGDRIGLVCPAGFLSPERFQSCLEQLTAWGFVPVTGKTMFSTSTSYFSGTDEERLADLQEMLDDPGIAAILCGRGGYGTSRIIDRLSFKKFRKHPKWVIGFSDITVLLAHIGRRYSIAAMHAPMAGAFANGEFANVWVQSLKAALAGKKGRYTTAPHPFNIPGKVTAPLAGGNLSLLAHMIGTPSMPKTRGRILFLEDLGEYLYAIDRMMVQLRRSGVLEGIGGLVLGGFTDLKDTDRPFGATVDQLLQHHLKGSDFPVCFGFPVSHTRENYALKTGVTYTLSVSAKSVRLTEQ